jgi:hypothetical protein
MAAWRVAVHVNQTSYAAWPGETGIESNGPITAEALVLLAEQSLGLATLFPGAPGSAQLSAWAQARGGSTAR